MNLIIIEHEPYNHRKRDHYHIESWLSKGVTVSYWDVQKAFNYSKAIDYNLQEDSEIVTKFFSIHALKEAILKRDKNKDVFIVETLLRSETIPIINLLTVHAFKWVRINYYLNPTGNIAMPSTWRQKLRRIKLWELPNKIAFKNWSAGPMNRPDITFVTGNAKPPSLNNSKKVVALNYFDWIEYKSLLGQESLIPHPYWVFLDIMLVNHPDGQRQGIKQRIDPHLYFDSMKNFFDQVEKSTGVPVVIASHPKANYQNNEFGQRDIIKFQTPKLIMHSRGVLTHGSLSISTALFAKKPLVYFYFGKLFNQNPHFSSLLYRMQQVKEKLDVTVIDASQEGLPNPPPAPNLQKYQDYIDSYYVGDPNSDNFEIIFKELSKLLKKD